MTWMRRLVAILIFGSACGTDGGDGLWDARRIDADESRPRYLHTHVDLGAQDELLIRQPLGVDSQGNAIVLKVEDGNLKSFRLSADPGVWGDVEDVESGPEPVTTLALAVTPSGEGFAFFAQDAQLHWNYFDAGVLVWDVEAILSTTCTFSGGAPDPVAGSDANGNVLVAWTCPLESAVHSKRWTQADRTWEPEALVPSGPEPRDLVLSVAPSGRAVAGWRTAAGALEVVQFDGLAWAPVQAMPSTSLGVDGVLSIAARDNGENLLAWEEPGSSTAFLRSSRWDPGTSTFQPMRTLAETTTNLGMQQFIASATVSSVDEDAVVLWGLWGAGLPSDTFVSRWHQGDADWASAVEIETLGFWPAAWMTPSGDALITWQGSYAEFAQLWTRSDGALRAVQETTESEMYGVSVAFAAGGDGVIAGRCILRDGAGGIAERRLCATLYRR
jgi:hypothetical protein